MGTENEKTSVDSLMADALGEPTNTIKVTMQDAALLLRSALTKAADTETNDEECKGIVQRCYAFTGELLNAPQNVTKNDDGVEEVTLQVNQSLIFDMKEDAKGTDAQKSWDQSISVLRKRMNPEEETPAETTPPKENDTSSDDPAPVKKGENWQWCGKTDINLKPEEEEDWGPDPK